MATEHIDISLRAIWLPPEMCDGHKHVYLYPPGRHREVLRTIGRHAFDPEHPLTPIQACELAEIATELRRTHG